MNILHLYPENDPLIARHVAMLDVHTSTIHHPPSTIHHPPSSIHHPPSTPLPDIVHIHGCWQYSVVRQALQAHRQGVRIVFTPHGGLEPWVINERRMSEKLCKTLLWQRRLAECSYVTIAQGKMEADALQQLGWNPRIETIRNAVITNSITQEAMVQQTQEVYRKVMDSNTLELMGDDTQSLLAQILKAGITGDKRWVQQTLPDINEDEWRRLLIYADNENVRTTVDKGTRTLGIQHPYMETAAIRNYLPTQFRQPRVEAHDVAGIVAEMKRGPLTLKHFVELDRALRRDNVDDEWLCDALDENHLLKYFRRLLQVLTEQTGLDEGFLPTLPLDDRRTQTIRKQLKNHLRI